MNVAHDVHVRLGDRLALGEIGHRRRDRPALEGAVGAAARELDVARRIAHGLTNKQIAAELVIAEGTADRHVANILGKLGFSSRAQVAAWVVEHAAGTGWTTAGPAS